MPAPLASNYALPEYAQLAPTDEISFLAPTAVAANEWKFVADGSYVYVVVAISASITTSAAAGNRTFSIEYLDPNGALLANIPPAAVQGPGAAVNYLASAQAPVLAAVSSSQLMPLTVIPMVAGMILDFFLSNRQAGDTFPAPMLTALRYSTEPVRETEPVRTPTPLLL